jgi:hypothetical protein
MLVNEAHLARSQLVVIERGGLLVLDFRSKMLHQRLATVKRLFHLEMRSLRSVAPNSRYVLTVVHFTGMAGSNQVHLAPLISVRPLRKVSASGRPIRSSSSPGDTAPHQAAARKTERG